MEVSCSDENRSGLAASKPFVEEEDMLAGVWCDCCSESFAMQDRRRGVVVLSLDEDRTRLAASFAEEDGKLADAWCEFNVEHLSDGFVLNLFPRMTVGLV